MITRLVTTIITLIILPFSLIFGVLRGAVVAVKGGLLPLEEIIDKTSFFLKPQIAVIEDTYENKFSVVNWESLAYSVAIAE